MPDKKEKMQTRKKDMSVMPVELIISRIFLLRGKNVMLDKDLAVLYGVKPIRLREQVKRNFKRFPADFMFRLTDKEAEFLVSQFAIPSKKHLGGHLPYAFTEQGVAMLSSVLNSDQAILVNIQIMRTFAKLREVLLTNAELGRKIKEVEKKMEKGFTKHDQRFKVVFEAIKQLVKTQAQQEEKPKKEIGFKA